MRKLDIYILRKFLGTFFFSLLLIMSIAVVFDFTEKIDDFISKGAPIKAIVFDYYLNFIPYFANLFTPLFIFISVIFFTSKMAYQSEIIAILSSGVSFRRMMFPYFLGALIIGLFSFTLGAFVIPKANVTRLKFETTYVKNKRESGLSNLHMQISPGTFIYLYRFYSLTETGDFFTIESFDGKRLKSKLTAQSIVYDTTDGSWILKDYLIRDFNADNSMKISKGEKIDSMLNLKPSDFKIERNYYETMTNPRLNAYIDEQRNRGVGNIEEFVIEKYKRIASPFSAFILTLIGVSLASRKTRGGMGLHIGTGIGLSFTYILFMTVSTTFAISGSMNSLLAVWLPNIVFAFIGLYLYKKAPK
ncbi:MAG: LptF/LptG family permease [Marinilabiliaceae bacterium]|nr:LptF/LptG family permease [Marinilabiliaceae bacterium]